LSAYDGMALIYEALEKARGETDGAVLCEAMKGLAWESPRGPIVDRVDDHLKNIEFETFPNMKDPSKWPKSTGYSQDAPLRI
jgi:branched-chain amino acid transport system substrate-binding protein